MEIGGLYMQKVYYNNDGWVCQRYPDFMPIENEENYLNVDEETYQKTLSSDVGMAWRVVNNELQQQVYNENDYNANNNLVEMEALKNWFNEYYTVQEQKLRRLHTLGKLTDDGQDPYQALINLYNLAEINRARIQELEALIG